MTMLLEKMRKKMTIGNIEYHLIVTEKSQLILFSDFKI
jgi:hypothetical protein